MKSAYENILKAVSQLSDRNIDFVTKQLKDINNHIGILKAQNDSFKRQLSGVSPKAFNDTLCKSIELLKLFGFSEYTFEGVSPMFLDWFIENTTTLTTFNPKLMNYYLFNSMQEAYYIVYANNQGTTPTYNQVKQTLLTFQDVIQEYERISGLSLPELIENLQTKN